MKMPWVHFYPDDWLAGTKRLKDDERGVYINICMLIYSRRGPVDIEDVKAFSSSHGNALNRIIQNLEKLGKIIRNGSEITQKRCENELETTQKLHEKQSEKARHRWNNNELGRTPVLPRGNAFISETETESESEKENKKEKRAVRASYSMEFESWWQGYPHKMCKGAARKAFEKALTKTSLDQLIAGVQRYKATKPIELSWCNPATWLNGERWLDVPAAANGHIPEVPERRTPRGPLPTDEELGLVPSLH